MSTYRKLAPRIIGGLVIVGLTGFVAIQFLSIRPLTNPPVVREPQWDSAQTRALMGRACFDCHSNETKWPAYAYVAPVSWMIVGEVNEGRHALNFSHWGPGENEEGTEAVEVIQKREMPPRQYLLLHPEARLTDAEVNQLIVGVRATFGSATENEYGEEGEARTHEDEDKEYEDEEEYEAEDHD